MAETHTLLAAISGSSGDPASAQVMYSIYQFVSASSLLQFVDDGGSPSVHNGTSYGTPSDKTFFQNNGSYMVVEPVSAETWQLKLTVDTTADDLIAEMAPNGGWTGGSFGAAVTSGAQVWNDGNNPPTTASVYLSESDNDGYTYLRCAIYDSVAPDFHEGFYAGGYTPVDATANTRPYVLLAGDPTHASFTGTPPNWGYDNVANRSRVAGNYGAAASMVECCIKGLEFNGDGQDYSSKWVLTPVYLQTVAGNVLGYFGQYTMLTVDTTKADRDTDSTGNYLVVNDLAFRWAP